LTLSPSNFEGQDDPKSDTHSEVEGKHGLKRQGSAQIVVKAKRYGETDMNLEHCTWVNIHGKLAATRETTTCEALYHTD
jgi:hypothetical protein